MPFNEARLASLQHIPVPGFPEIGKADVSLNLVAGFSTSDRLFMFNNVSYQDPPTP
ncbi:hypothetical protein AZE42_14181, partial [Rhizopogon vesiculosus]